MTSTMPVNMIDNVQQDLWKPDDRMGRSKESISKSIDDDCGMFPR